MTADIASRHTHPMVLIAAIAVTLFAMTGIAALMGWIPGSTGPQTPGASRPVAPAEFAHAAPPAAAPATAPAVAPTAPPAAKPVAEKRTARPDARKDSQPAQASRQAAPVRVANADTTASEPAPAARVEAAYPPPPAGVYTQSDAARPRTPCFDCGTIESVRQIEKKGEGSGLGAVAGGLLGGLLGHQTGGGRGRDVMTVVGAVGGAVAGHQIEKNTKKSTAYEVTVRFEDGTTRVLQQASEPAWRMGDRVRVINSEIVPAS